jgi:biotin carboxyl carrier protein
MKYRYQSGDVIYEVTLDRHGDGYRVTVTGADGEARSYDLEVLDAQPGTLSLRFDDPAGAARPQVVYWAADGDTRWLSSRGCTYRLDRPQGRRARGSAGAGAGDSVRAPMPAQVRAVAVAAGDVVVAGQTLLLLEAMKMEIRLAAPRPGRVNRVLAQPGETVARDQVLVEMATDA